VGVVVVVVVVVAAAAAVAAVAVEAAAAAAAAMAVVAVVAVAVGTGHHRRHTCQIRAAMVTPAARGDKKMTRSSRNTSFARYATIDNNSARQSTFYVSKKKT